jgi:hypothetical protein
LWTALRRDPGQFFELATLYALPQLSPEVIRWSETWPLRHPGETPLQLALRANREATRTAAFGGALIGSSFYVGIIPATAMIYFDQLVTILRVAAIYGHDPADPLRAAEILVIQGRYRSIAEANQGLQSAAAGSERAIKPGRLARLRIAIRELLAMIGLQLNRFRSPVEVIVTSAEVVAYLIPLISIPVWMVANMRTAKRLGRDATDFYHQYPITSEARANIEPPPLAQRHRRRYFIGKIIASAVIFAGLTLVILPRGYLSHHLPFGGFLLAETVLIWSLVRLIRITRP